MARGEGNRRRSEKQKAIGDDRPQAVGRVFTTLGGDAAERWLVALGLPVQPRWHAEISVLAGGETRFDLNIYPEEWGFSFQHGGRTSWIRVTDVPFVHGRDEFQLLSRVPDLLGIDVLLTDLERDHGIEFQRATASLRSDISSAADIVREWLLQPLPTSTVKKTVELCDDEMRPRIRCSHAKGHDGDHEYLGIDGSRQLRWK